MNRALRYIMVLMALVMVSVGNVWGAKYTATTNGNWNNAKTWGKTGSVYPKLASDYVTIGGTSGTKIAVTVNAAAQVNVLTVNKTGTLNVSSPLTTYGDVTINGTLNLTSDLFIHGTLTNNGTISGNGSIILVDEAHIYGTDITVGTLEMDFADENAHIAYIGVNMTVTNLEMNQGAISIEEGYTIVTNGVTINDESCYIEGKLTINDNSDEVTLPLGDSDIKGYMKVSGASGMWSAQYHARKPEEGSSEEAYSSLNEEYWELTNENDAEPLRCTVWLRIGAQNADYKRDPAEWKSAMYEYTSEWTEIGGDEYDGEKYVSNAVEIEAGGVSLYTFGLKGTLLSTIDHIEYETEPVYPEYTWTGLVDEDWNNQENWLGGNVPDEYADVKIYAAYSGQMKHTTTTHMKNGDKDVSVTYDEETEDTEVTIFPIVWESAYAGTIEISDGTQLVIDGGALFVTGALTVETDEDNESVVIRNSYWYSSALKYGSTNYSHYKIENTLETARAYYLGTATKEGVVDGMVNDDILKVYNASTRRYENTDRMGLYGGSVRLWSDNHDDEEEVTISLTGSLYDRNVTIPLTYAGEETKNCVVNPYAFPIPLKGEYGIFKMNNKIWPTVTFRTYNGEEYCYTTYSYGNDVTVSEYVNGDDYNDETDYVSLAPQQGFYLIAEAAGAQLTYNVESLDAVSWYDYITYGEDANLKSAKVAPADVLRLIVSGRDNRNCDETAIVFRDGGMETGIREDSRKDERIADHHSSESFAKKNMVYVTKQDKTNCAVSRYPEASEMVGKPISLTVLASSEMEEGMIYASKIGDFDEKYDVLLYDAVTEETTNLRTSAAEFTTTKGADLMDRFYIRLVEATPTGIEADAVESDNIGIYNTSNGVKISFHADKGNAAVNVYDLAGRIVTSRTIETETEVTLPDTKGLYIVEVVTPNAKKSAKINR